MSEQKLLIDFVHKAWTCYVLNKKKTNSLLTQLLLLVTCF